MLVVFSFPFPSHPVSWTTYHFFLSPKGNHLLTDLEKTIAHNSSMKSCIWEWLVRSFSGQESRRFGGIKQASLGRLYSAEPSPSPSRGLTPSCP